MRTITLLLCFALAAPAWAADSGTFRASRLQCAIGNNAAAGEHRAGYNGIFRLSAPGDSKTVYVPAFAGVNLEHYPDASPRSEDRAIFFEPRHAPMKFRKVDNRAAELHQPATPHWAVESWTRFAVRDPHYIDVTYRAVPRRDDYQGGFLGVFWASYINGPQDKSIYFLRDDSSLNAPRWAQFCTQSHGRDSTVLAHGAPTDLDMGDDPASLFRNLSPLRYAEPFYYGRVGEMVLIYIFQPNPHLRFAHSPSGGGRSASGNDTNPAWDFQLVIPKPEKGKEYRLEMRVVYKRWAGRQDVINEVKKWLNR
ncbi:MAG: hypothetical protein GY953_00855 [bacterium]|nr:hypothetical protein [bacterium]